MSSITLLKESASTVKRQKSELRRTFSSTVILLKYVKVITWISEPGLKRPVVLKRSVYHRPYRKVILLWPIWSRVNE